MNSPVSTVEFEETGDYRFEQGKRHRAAALHDAGATDCMPILPRGYGVRQPYAALASVRWQGRRNSLRKDRGLLTSAATRIVEAAFSLIEIMVTIALLSFIVLGLLAMFNQTQRAFRSSMTQVDVLEAGRAVTDIVARDLEQMVPGQLGYFLTNNALILTTNFYAEHSSYFPPIAQMPAGIQPPLLLQGLPGTVGPGGQECRTNCFQDVFFLAKQNLDYLGIGYQVRPEYQNGIVGTLYRFSTNRTKNFAGLLSSEFRQATVINWNNPNGNTTPPNMSRIADGVVHFRVTAYDTNGFPFNYNTLYTNAMFRTNGYVRAFEPGSGYTGMRNSRISAPIAAMPDHYNYYFFSNAVPAYLELEVGFLEPHILDRLRGLNGNPVAQYQYLSNHVANVHLFRRRIPIRNVDFLAYQ